VRESTPRADGVDVSVVIPARNEEALVAGALASVAGQDWPHERLEAIVVANGCSDDTVGAVRSFMNSNGTLPIRLLSVPESGAARAKNAGAAASRGRLLVFLDADSKMTAGLARRVVQAEAGGTTAGSIRMVADSSDPLDRGFFELIEVGKRLGVQGNMFFCRRSDFERVGGFDPVLNHAEDLDLLNRLRSGGIPLGHIADEAIATSPRRLRSLPLRLAMVTTLARWALGHAGIGRSWPY
jgi:glycosyltransferase involved in cell wall biosynthesis